MTYGLRAQLPSSLRTLGPRAPMTGLDGKVSPLLYDGEQTGVFGIWSEQANFQNGRPIAAPGHSIDADKVIASMDSGAYFLEVPIVPKGAQTGFLNGVLYILGQGPAPMVGGFYVRSPQLNWNWLDPMFRRDRFQPGGKGGGLDGGTSTVTAGGDPWIFVGDAGDVAADIGIAGTVTALLANALGSAGLSALGGVFASIASGLTALIAGNASVAGALYGTYVGIEASLLGVQLGASLGSIAAGGGVGLAAAAVIGSMMGLSAALQPRNVLDAPHLKSVSGHLNMRTWYETIPIPNIKISNGSVGYTMKPGIAASPWKGSDSNLEYSSPREQLEHAFPSLRGTFEQLGKADRLYPIGNVNTVDPWTWFAGLVRLQTSVTQPASLAHDDAIDTIWIQRVPDEGIAAFRAARARGEDVSTAIAAAIPSIVGTAFEANADDLSELVRLHRENEQQALRRLHDMKPGSGMAAFAARTDAKTLQTFQVLLADRAGVGSRNLRALHGAVLSSPSINALRAAPVGPAKF